MQKTKPSSTSYDDVFRTLLNDCPNLMIPVVNEIFHCNYSFNENLTFSNNELFITAENGNQKKRITDSIFKLGNAYYHIECQSTEDGTMLIRIFEYDSQIALQNIIFEEEHLTVEFPQTALLYLRHKRSLQDFMTITIKVPDDSCTYRVPVMKIQTYTVAELFEKKLFFLIPFHIFVYEQELEQCNKNQNQLEQLQKIYEEILKRLNECVLKKELTEYQKQTIIDMSKKVLNQIAQKYEYVKERIGDTMGGKILDYEAKDILNAGREEGLKDLIVKKLKKQKSIEQIADELESEVSVIQKLIASMEK